MITKIDKANTLAYAVKGKTVKSIEILIDKINQLVEEENKN